MSSWGKSWGNSWKRSWGLVEIVTAIVNLIPDYIKSIFLTIESKIITLPKEHKNVKI